MKLITTTIFSITLGFGIVSAGDSELIPVPSQSTPRTINTMDPVTGRPIVSSVPTYAVVINDPKKPGVIGQTIVIGFSDQTSYDLVRRSDQPTIQLYANAARQHAMVSNGQIVPLESNAGQTGTGKNPTSGSSPTNGTPGSQSGSPGQSGTAPSTTPNPTPGVPNGATTPGTGTDTPPNTGNQTPTGP